MQALRTWLSKSEYTRVIPDKPPSGDDPGSIGPNIMERSPVAAGAPVKSGGGNPQPGRASQ